MVRIILGIISWPSYLHSSSTAPPKQPFRSAPPPPPRGGGGRDYSGYYCWDCGKSGHLAGKGLCKQADITAYQNEGIDIAPHIALIDASSNVNSVKGRLREMYKEWEKLKPPNFVLSVIRTGYRIPFSSPPPPYQASNNKSALDNTEFVSQEVQ